MKQDAIATEPKNTEFFRKSITAPLRQAVLPQGDYQQAATDEWMDRDKLARVVEAVVSQMADAQACGPTLWSRQLVRRQQILLSVLCYGYATGVYATSELYQRLLSDKYARRICEDFEISQYCLTQFRHRHFEMIKHSLTLTLAAAFSRNAGAGKTLFSLDAGNESSRALSQEAELRLRKAIERDMAEREE